MQRTEHRAFQAPDEVREFRNGRAEILQFGEAEIGRLVFEPGWRWSQDVKPIAQTASCEAPHFQYHVAGELAIAMDDGTEFVARPGDVTSLPSGHDAWVVGAEPVVVVDGWAARSRWLSSIGSARASTRSNREGDAGDGTRRRPGGGRRTSRARRR